MNLSFRLGRVLGIELKVHVTFLLLLVWAALSASSGGVGAMVFNVVFILLLFVCVTLHELGHAEVAQRHGVPVREIILLPIGGLAVLGRNPKTPREELLIAIAGPLVNVVIALGMGIGFAMAGYFGRANLEEMVHQGPHSFGLLIERLFQANVALALFNLIPAFPMDGGRILRGILGFYMPPVRATRIATGVSQVVAIGLFVYAVTPPTSILMAIIAGFVFLAAGVERNESQAGTILATRRVGDAYNRFAIVLSLSDRVSNVVDYLLKSYQPDFAVVDRGQLQGIVTREDVTRWLASNKYDVFVTEIMEEPSRVLKVSSEASLDEVRVKLAESGHRVAAVYEADHYLGLVSLEDIAEAMHILTFLDRASGGGQYSTARRVGVSGPVVQPM